MKTNCTDVLNDADQHLPVIPGREEGVGASEGGGGGGTWGYENRFHTVKSHFKALGLYNFIRGFEWAYRRGSITR